MMLFLFAETSWTYVAGGAILLIGIVFLLQQRRVADSVAEGLINLGPLFLAVPMAVFAGDHFVFTKFMVNMIPSWIPWHVFWLVFVGICLLAGALALATRRCAALAAALFGIMLLLFEVLLHIPGAVRAQHNRFLWTIVAREFTFASGALAFAATAIAATRARLAGAVITGARVVIGVAITFFGIENLLHPEFRPAVPLKGLTPTWIPGHLFWSYLTGAAFVAGGLLLLMNVRTRAVATWLGGFVLLLVMAVYLPIMATRFADIGDGLNYFADTLMLSGSLLCFAGSQPAMPGGNFQ